MKYLDSLRKTGPQQLIFIVAGSLGALIFVLFYGVTTIDPTNTSWISSGGLDMSQQYIGWLFYRQSDWTFPIGIINDLAYPYGLGVTYMDSIPLLAIPSKLVSSLLPTTFQYFGLWGLLCYILQGGLSALIVKHLTKDSIVAVCVSLIFILSPVMLDRMFVHTSLAGHWIILAGILCLLTDSRATARQFIFRWTVIMSLSALVHPYFVPMSLFLLLLSAVLTQRTSLPQMAIRLVTPVMVMVVLFWLVGGLSVGADVSDGGLGAFTHNLNSIFNPSGFSAFLPTLPSSPGGYEGFAYLGLGVLAVSLFSGYIIVTKINKAKTKKYFSNIPRRHIAAALLVGGLLFASVGPIVHVGAHQLVLPIPPIIEKGWSVFRANGRLFWPLYYLLAVAVIVIAYRYLNRKTTYTVLVAFFAAILVMQSVDILGSDRAKSKHERFVHTPAYISGIDNTLWRQQLKGKRHIQYLVPADKGTSTDIAYIAAERRVTLSDGYFARSPGPQIAMTARAGHAKLIAGDADRDTLYISDNEAFVNSLRKNSALRIARDHRLYLISSR